jgi:hypothetical protein
VGVAGSRTLDFFGISSGFPTRLCFSHNQPELRFTRAIEAKVGRMSGVELTGDW